MLSTLHLLFTYPSLTLHLPFLFFFPHIAENFSVGTENGRRPHIPVKGYPEKQEKAGKTDLVLVVGVDGFEPPTLCL